MNWWQADPVAAAPGGMPAAMPFWHTDPVATPPRPGFNPDGTPDLSGVLGGAGEAANNTPADVARQMGTVVAGQPALAHSMARGLPFEDRAEAALRAPFNGGDYSGQLAKVRDEAAAANAANPIGEGVAETAGGMLMPLGALGSIVRGATLGAKVARGALAGGVTGSAYGVSNTPDLTPNWRNAKQTAINAGVGGVTGAALGGVFPAAARGIGNAYRTVAGASVPRVGGVSRPALNSMNDLIDATGGANAVRGELAPLGPEARIADAGPPMQSLTKGIGTGEPGSASDNLVRTLAARAAATPSRIGADVDSAMGPHLSANEAADNLRAQARVARAGRAAIYASAPPIDVRPVIAAIDGTTAAPNTPLARTLAYIRSTLTGPVPAPQLPQPATAAQYQQWQAAHQAWQASGGTGPITDALTLQRAKESMDGLIEYQNGKSVGVGPMVGADPTTQGIIKGIRATLNHGVLRQQVPGYASAMDRGASIKQQLTQLDQGADHTFSRANNDPYAFQRDWNATTSPDGIGMAQTPTFSGGIGLRPPGGSPLSAQQLARQIGMRHAVQMGVDNSANDLTALNGIVRGLPDASGIGAGNNLQNIETAFGRPAAQTLADAIRREQRFAATNEAAAQGTKTASSLAGQAAAQPPAPFQLGGEFHNITGPVEAGLGAAHGTVNAILRATQAGAAPAYRNDLSRILAARLSDPLGQQVLANNAARASNRALAAPVAQAATRALGIPAAVLGGVLSNAQRERQRRLAPR